MANFTNIRRSAAAAIGALVISTACIGAAVGPATAQAQSPAGYAALQVPASAQANA